MEATLARVAEIQSQPTQVSKPRNTRKSRQQTEEGVRYFLAKDGSSIEKPELGTEVASEGEALIKAFQSKNGVIYTVLAYKAEAEIHGGSPTLVRRPIRK
jgi:predicted extracellular nuclease